MSAANEQATHRERKVWSAGGVLVRPDPSGNGWSIVICGRSGSKLWALPKGTPESGESRKQTAIREVHEETGIEPRLLKNSVLNVSRYKFTRNEVVHNKTVYYYLMSPVEGSVEMHDQEYDKVVWVPIDKSLSMLTHYQDVYTVRNAIQALQNS